MSSPFNEERYNTLLKGLEVSEINYSEVCLENRYDSEYFQKKFVFCERVLKENDYNLVSDLFKVTDGEHGSVVYQNSGIRYLTAENIKKGYVDITNVRYVTDKVDERNKRARVKAGDILVSIKGTLGEIAIAERWLPPANMNRDVAILKPLSEQLVTEPFAAFLQSKFGYLQAMRGGSGGVQQMITLERLRKFILPSFSSDFHNLITIIYNRAKELRVAAQENYAKAETLLYEILDLKSFEPCTDSINIKNLSESFQKTGRLDAEYYQKKYEEVMDHILKVGFDSLENISIIKKSIEPGSEYYSNEGLPFLRVSDFNKFGISNPGKKLSLNFCHDNEELIESLKPKKDTILFSKDGSVGIAYMIEEDADFITSGAILQLIIRNKDFILPQYLTLVLNSKLIQMQSERDAGGSIILHWSLKQIKKVIVPIIKIEDQIEIAELVRQSFNLKSQSETLCKNVSKAVEIAIEEGETRAIEYANEFLN